MTKEQQDAVSRLFAEQCKVVAVYQKAAAGVADHHDIGRDATLSLGSSVDKLATLWGLLHGSA